jgi:hypothetical protein
VVGSTLPDGSPIPAVPASEADANSTVDAIVGQQSEDWKAQNVGFFAGVNANLQASGIPWGLWLVGGLAVFGLVVSSGGSPRRYGR